MVKMNKEIIRRLIIAIVTLVAVVIPSIGSVIIHSQGAFTIRQTWMGDLDEGSETSNFDVAEIWFEATTDTERYLVPVFGITMAIVSTEGYSSCTSATLSTAKINIDDLHADTLVCVLTNEGRYSQFRVLEDVPESPTEINLLSISYTTWEESTDIRGDVNSDGSITASDALLYLRYAVGQDISPYHIDESYDVTCDGNIFADDALLVLRRAVNQPVDLDCP